MEPSRFTDAKSGQLVPVTLTHGQDWAFIPNPLPDEWDLPAPLVPLLVEARAKLGTLDGIGQNLSDPHLLLRPLQNREAVQSSSLEGTDVLAIDYMGYQLNPEDPTSTDDKRNAQREVNNHNAALLFGYKEISTGKPFLLRGIRDMHERLLSGVRGKNKRPGEFRNILVGVGAGRYVPPPVADLDECLKHFEVFLNRRDAKTDPLVRAYMAHYQFEAIHPFQDGNGRIGRVLLSLTTYEWLGHSLPWLYMSPYLEQHKDEYFRLLFRVSTHGDWAGWMEFCLRATIEQCRDSIHRCNSLLRLRREYHVKADALSPRMHKAIDSLFDRPVFRISDYQKACNCTWPTAQADINLLIKAEIVQHLPESKKPRYYFAPGILGIVFAQDFWNPAKKTAAESAEAPQDAAADKQT